MGQKFPNIIRPGPRFNYTLFGPVRFGPPIPDSGTDRGRRNIGTLLVIRLKMRKFEIVTEPCSDIRIIAVGQGVLFMFQLKCSIFSIFTFFSFEMKKLKIMRFKI